MTVGHAVSMRQLGDLGTPGPRDFTDWLSNVMIHDPDGSQQLLATVDTNVAGALITPKAVCGSESMSLVPPGDGCGIFFVLSATAYYYQRSYKLHTYVLWDSEGGCDCEVSSKSLKHVHMDLKL